MNSATKGTDIYKTSDSHSGTAEYPRVMRRSVVIPNAMLDSRHTRIRVKAEGDNSEHVL